jgi:hypothetical protein
MKAPQIDAATARRELPAALRGAAAHLRAAGDFNFLNDEPEVFTTFQLATLIEQLTERLASGDDSVGRRLWGIFAPTCTWDDAGGDSLLGQTVFELTDRLFRPA